MKDSVNAYYPLNKLASYIMTREKIKKWPEFKGFPVCDVYGLTYDEVYEYMEQLSNIERDTCELYKGQGSQISTRTLILFGLCYLIALVLGIMADPLENPNSIYFLLSFVFLILPFGIRELHKKLYKRKHHRLIYNYVIEKYIIAIDSYKDYYEKKKDYVFKQGATKDNYYEKLTSF